MAKPSPQGRNASVHTSVFGVDTPDEVLYIDHVPRLQIGDLRYFASQPWPFPHSLMVGFTASYAGGTIRIDPAEIEEAGWYSYQSLPTLPAAGSITRILIDLVVEEISRDTKC